MGLRSFQDNDEEFSYRAYRKAMRPNGSLRGYEDGETITFGQRFEYIRISRDFDEQVRYWEMRLDGQSHNMAEMLATRSFPGAKGTDRAFMQGRGTQLGGGQFDRLPKRMGERYVNAALAAGVNPTGKWYSGPLARFPADPRAWVDSLSDVRRIAEERGAEVSGAVDVKPPTYAEQVEPKPYHVAPDIVARRLADRLATEPDLQGKKKDELVHEMSQKAKGIMK